VSKDSIKNDFSQEKREKFDPQADIRRRLTGLPESPRGLPVIKESTNPNTEKPPIRK
jgi:hypothetical protein